MPPIPWTVERLLERADREGPCLIWRPSKDRWGYGRVLHNGHTVGVHRVRWELARGPIPSGLNVCHTCDRTACIELLHLFLGTAAANNLDMKAKGRLVASRGERNGNATISDATAGEMRALARAGVSLNAIAKRFGCAWDSVRHAIATRP